MNDYVVIIEKNGKNVSTFAVEAKNLKDARKKANLNKRMNKLSGKTIIRRSK